jgi:DNA-binding LytR/AlgR family response regulator
LTSIRVIIADDESALRGALKRKLAQVWPNAVIIGEAQNGPQALQMIEVLAPQVAFLDIRMPGLTGMDVARRITGNCMVVFVTAFDQYAVNAFENAAIDYLLKPVTTERLAKTVARLKQRLLDEKGVAPQAAAIIETLLARVSAAEKSTPLKWIRVLKGDTLRMIATDDISCFQAKDKYTAVLTPSDEFLIRKPIRELADELDPQMFWRVHRGRGKPPTS